MPLASRDNIIVIYNLDINDRCHVVLDQLPDGVEFKPRHVLQGLYLTNTTSDFYSRDAKRYPRISKQEFESRFGRIEYP